MQNGEFFLEMQKTATILDDAKVGIGWQQSWIVRRWCAYWQCAGESPLAPPSLGRVLMDTLLFLLGLALSWVMLSLGAPFWYQLLSRVLNLKSAVQTSKTSASQPLASSVNTSGH